VVHHVLEAAKVKWDLGIGSTLLLHTSLSFLFSLAELPIQSFTRVALPVPFGELAPGVEEPADC
jgi:hypothetical protein